jgi:hypothetical protein
LPTLHVLVLVVILFVVLLLLFSFHFFHLSCLICQSFNSFAPSLHQSSRFCFPSFHSISCIYLCEMLTECFFRLERQVPVIHRAFPNSPWPTVSAIIGVGFCFSIVRIIPQIHPCFVMYFAIDLCLPFTWPSLIFFATHIITSWTVASAKHLRPFNRWQSLIVIIPWIGFSNSFITKECPISAVFYFVAKWNVWMYVANLPSDVISL